MTHLSTERIVDGYKLTFSEVFETPELIYDGAKWHLTTEWIRTTDSLRAKIISILYNSRASLFKNSPSQKTLENLLLPWVVINESGDMLFKCDLPLPDSNKEGKGKIVVNGITIKQAGITPDWLISSYDENTPVVEFDWNESSSMPETEFREITLIESEVPLEDTADTLRLNTDEEYNTRKFAAKERVKEARLKAILARRAAEVETTRYYTQFSIGDNESTFSEYDISDYSDDESQNEDDEKPNSEA
jgi:hypothetical protein